MKLWYKNLNHCSLSLFCILLIIISNALTSISRKFVIQKLNTAIQNKIEKEDFSISLKKLNRNNEMELKIYLNFLKFNLGNLNDAEIYNGYTNHVMRIVKSSDHLILKSKSDFIIKFSEIIIFPNFQVLLDYNTITKNILTNPTDLSSAKKLFYNLEDLQRNIGKKINLCKFLITKSITRNLQLNVICLKDQKDYISIENLFGKSYSKFIQMIGVESLNFYNSTILLNCSQEKFRVIMKKEEVNSHPLIKMPPPERRNGYFKFEKSTNMLKLTEEIGNNVELVIFSIFTNQINNCDIKIIRKIDIFNQNKNSNVGHFLEPKSISKNDSMNAKCCIRMILKEFVNEKLITICSALKDNIQCELQTKFMRYELLNSCSSHLSFTNRTDNSFEKTNHINTLLGLNVQFMKNNVFVACMNERKINECICRNFPSSMVCNLNYCEKFPNNFECSRNYCDKKPEDEDACECRNKPYSKNCKCRLNPHFEDCNQQKKQKNKDKNFKKIRKNQKEKNQKIKNKSEDFEKFPNEEYDETLKELKDFNKILKEDEEYEKKTNFKKFKKSNLLDLEEETKAEKLNEFAKKVDLEENQVKKDISDYKIKKLYDSMFELKKEKLNKYKIKDNEIQEEKKFTKIKQYKTDSQEELKSSNIKKFINIKSIEEEIINKLKNKFDLKEKSDIFEESKNKKISEYKTKEKDIDFENVNKHVREFKKKDKEKNLENEKKKKFNDFNDKNTKGVNTLELVNNGFSKFNKNNKENEFSKDFKDYKKKKPVEEQEKKTDEINLKTFKKNLESESKLKEGQLPLFNDNSERSEKDNQ